MSGFGVICNCCTAGGDTFNVCSFETDGTLRWAVRWTAIDGSASGGMDVFDQNNRRYISPSIHVLGTRLVAVGTKSGNIYVAALNLSDGSEALSLTDTGQAYNTNNEHVSPRYTIVVGSEIVFGGIKGSGTTEAVERYAVDNAGNITVTTDTSWPAEVGVSASFLSPAGELCAHKATSTGFQFLSLDGSGTSGSDTVLFASQFQGSLVADTEYFYGRTTPEGGSASNAHVFKSAVPFGGGFSSVTISPPSGVWSSIFSGYTIHSMSKADEDHAWVVAGTTNAVLYHDFPYETNDFTIAYSSLSIGSVNSVYIDDDNVIYMVPSGTGAMGVSGVTSAGSIYDISSSLPDNIFESGSTRVYSDSSTYVNASWKTNSSDANNLVRLRQVSGNLDGQWIYSGAPRLCNTKDGSGNIYCANYNGEDALAVSGLYAHDFPPSWSAMSTMTVAVDIDDNGSSLVEETPSNSASVQSGTGWGKVWGWDDGSGGVTRELRMSIDYAGSGQYTLTFSFYRALGGSSDYYIENTYDLTVGAGTSYLTVDDLNGESFAFNHEGDDNAFPGIGTEDGILTFSISSVT